MVEDRGPKKTTFEDLLMDSIFNMRVAKREGAEYLFDELLDEVEMLFDLIPELSQSYLSTKQELERLASQNIQQIKAEAATIDDPILKDLFLAQKTAIVKWEFRTDMLDSILKLMNEYQMIPYANPYVGELGLGELEETYVETEDDIPMEEQPETFQPQPQPQSQQSNPQQPPPTVLPPFPSAPKTMPATTEDLQPPTRKRRQLPNE